MKTARSWFGLVMAFIPVLFCGGLLIYFNNVRELGGGFFDEALGPTMIGLAAFGLLFLLLFIWKLRRTAAPPAPPKDRIGDRVEAALAEAKSDFDPDAAIARYMARRNAGEAGSDDVPPVRPGSFGRKGTLQ